MKQYIRYIVLCTLVFTSCQDDFYDSEYNLDKAPPYNAPITSQLLTHNDIIKNAPLVEEIRSFQSKIDAGRERSSSQDETILIDTNEGVILENGNTTSYIFQILLPNLPPSTTTIYNIIITNTDDRWKSYVVHYDLTQEEMDTIEAIDYSTLASRTYFLDIDVDIETLLDEKKNNRSVLYECPPGSCCTSHQDISPSTGWTVTTYTPVSCNEEAVTSIGADSDDTNQTGGGGGGESNNSDGNSQGNDPYDDYDPQNGGLNGGGTYGGGDSPNNTDTTSGSGTEIITTVFFNDHLDVLLLINTINSYLDIPLTEEQEDWILSSEENINLANKLLDFLLLNNSQDDILFAQNIIDNITTSGNLPVFTENDFPGLEESFPFEWWKDDDFIINSGNLDMASETISAPFETPNAREALLFATFPYQALLHVENSQDALDKSQSLAANNTFNQSIVKSLVNGKGDAFRHSYWNALDTAEFGEAITKLFTDAHEFNQSGLDVDMDLFNNSKGRQIAIDNNFSFFTSSETISSSILTAVTNGNLKYIFPTDINGTILNSSTLIQTNQ